MKNILPLFLPLLFLTTTHAAESRAEVKNLSVNGGIEDGKARLVIEAMLNGLPGDRDKIIFATTLQHSIKVTRDKVTHSIAATLDILEGTPKELALAVGGEGEIKTVVGEGLLDWSIRQETNGMRTLVLRPRKLDKPLTQLIVNVTAERDLKSWTNPLKAFSLSPVQPALFNGFVKIEFAPELDVQPDSPTGLFPVEIKYLPAPLRAETKPDEAEPLAFQFHGSAYSLPLRITVADPETRRVVLRDFKLVGQLGDQTAAFRLTATARVRNPDGGNLILLSGSSVALTDLDRQTDWRARFDNGRFLLTFDKPGDFPIAIKFNAGVRQSEGWNVIDFRIAPSTLQPLVLQGLAPDTQFQFVGGARPERTGIDFLSYLPSDGTVSLSWKAERPEAEGKLFYAAEMLSQIRVSPGLMQQVALIDGKVMQGELTRLTLRVRGSGEVTRVQGDQVLAWNVEPASTAAERLLVVQFNQPQKDQFALQVQMQTPLGAFPVTAEAMQMRPEGATRFAGYVRIVNEGAVRLEVVQASGLSQISPEQFPQTGAAAALLAGAGSQRFAYRFSSADYALRIQADQILPELTVSEVLAYHLGENELAVDAEIEVDVREAPLRELLLRVPKGYAVARLNASGMNDYFLREPDDQTDAELRLVYGTPVSGRQIVQLRLEYNQALGTTNWSLPRLEVVKAKSVRGHVGVSADAGFRLTPARTQALTEIATAFFPRKVGGIQSAFRLSEAGWAATMRVERLPQTVQANTFHLFSIGEGIAYGSSVMNYLISGAPISAFRVDLSEEYFNVEFTGKDVRNWQKTATGYLVQLHTPVSGAYTLLATYERPFKSQGETLGFTGARPLDAQTEQGHTLVISAYQFQVQPVEVSTGLLPLETGEVPSEYRLFFDAPILAAYRYTSRPFNLRLALSPLAQGDSLSQVVDRASLTTRISKEGQVLTDVRYFVKNRGHPNFRLTLPEGTQLWSATVDGAAVVPVTDAKSNLIPLPQRSDPNAVLTLDLKLASRSGNPRRVTVAAPVLSAPVMLAEWKLEPDTGQRLVYRKGSLTPAGGMPDVSGFAGLTRLFMGPRVSRAWVSLLSALVLVGISVMVWRWTAQEGVYKFSARHLAGTLLGLVSFVMALAAFVQLGGLAANQIRFAPDHVLLLAPVQQANSALQVEVGNVAAETSSAGFLGYVWPVLIALGVWIYAWLTDRPSLRSVAGLLVWTFAGWGTLRWPNGAAAFFCVILAFLVWHVVIPALRRLGQLPRKPRPAGPTETGPAPAVAAILMGLLCFWGAPLARSADSQSAVSQISNLHDVSSCPAPAPIGLTAEARWTQSGKAATDLAPIWKPTLQDVGDASEYSDAGFPLTPALSQGEREIYTPSWERSSVSRLSPVLLSGRAEAGDEASAPRIIRRRSSLFPLPGGEGQGEGERGARRTQAVGLLAQASAQPDGTGSGSPSRVQLGDTADYKSALRPKEAPLAELVAQQIRVEEKFALVTAKVRWPAVKGQMLPLLFEPAVMTRVVYPTNALKLVRVVAGARAAQQLLAQESGLFDVEVHYQLQVTKKETESGFTLPTQFGLINELNLTLINLDVEVRSPQAVSVRRDRVGSNTIAKLVLSPVNDAWIGWQPRSRDLKIEKPLFYAEWQQLYVPLAGVIEGVHHALVRPAQGELSELVFDVPAGATVTDVTGANLQSVGRNPNSDQSVTSAATNSVISLWRFDPDTRKLRVNLTPAQSRPFALVIRSQFATGPLPFEQSVGLLSVENASGQIGLLGVATGNEVQLDTVSAEALSPINLEDFPANVAQTLAAQVPGLTVRRAYRFADATATATLKASPVEPDVRVETQDTLSLGEDRTVLAVNATVNISRAGIFRLSFVLPTGLDVESISGPALSHWTELKAEAGRVITLHLQGKTEGQQQFAINLAGPGVKPGQGWAVPRVALREAGKQRGTLVIVPEQGMRLQVAARDGLTQLDPQRSGIRQKGVLAFRVLQTPWNLTFDIEQVDPWVQVTSLQHATVSEALVKVIANLQYQIENTGLKSFRVFLPTNAENVRFQGEQVADFLVVPGTITNAMQAWEVKLHRRVLGQYLLQASYQTIMPEQTQQTMLRGVQAADVNLQRGFVTVQSGGRLQVRVESPPAALQPTEWQSIPRALQQELTTASANFAYRLVEPSFQLLLQIDRHEAARLLPARVNNITFTSVISDDGVMLTQARLEMLPGDMRLLDLTLPKDALFWFAFVNQNGVWPWRKEDSILIPLEQQSRSGGVIVVEFLYSSRIGAAGGRNLDLNLLGPKFDLPLENITWQVYLNEKWKVQEWTGSLQLQEERLVPRTAGLDMRAYLEHEASAKREKTKEAEQMLALGNSALERGDPQQARRAFQAAYGLSQGDDAFNEDARVQLNNLKLQQALVGLNVRQAAGDSDTDVLTGKLRELRGRKEANYTQQDAKALIDRRSAEENAALMRLAQRLIQQQEAAVSSPGAIRASIPEQGRLLTFKRSVLVDTWADLKIGLEAKAVKTAAWGVRFLILVGTMVLLGAFAWAARSFRRTGANITQG